MAYYETRRATGWKNPPAMAAPASGPRVNDSVRIRDVEADALNANTEGEEVYE